MTSIEFDISHLQMDLQDQDFALRPYRDRALDRIVPRIADVPDPLADLGDYRDLPEISVYEAAFGQFVSDVVPRTTESNGEVSPESLTQGILRTLANEVISRSRVYATKYGIPSEKVSRIFTGTRTPETQSVLHHKLAREWHDATPPEHVAKAVGLFFVKHLTEERKVLRATYLRDVPAYPDN